MTGDAPAARAGMAGDGPAARAGMAGDGPAARAGMAGDGPAGPAGAALAARRAAAEQRIEALRGEFDGIVASAAQAGVDDEHDPEGATLAFERAQLAALLDQARRQLADLDEALGRLREGRYGMCERCGQPVSPARLAARPAARTCIGCAR